MSAELVKGEVLRSPLTNLDRMQLRSLLSTGVAASSPSVQPEQLTFPRGDGVSVEVMHACAVT